MDGPGPGNHHNIPTGLEFILVQTINFPQSSADPIAHHSMTQLLADGNAHPIGVGAVASGIEYQMAVGLTGSPVKPLENVVKFQTL